MKFALVLLAACVSTGCTVNMRLLEDGKVHQGTFSPASKTITAVIDGDSYSGPASQGMGVGFGQTFYGGKVGFGTTTVASGQWQGLLTNKSGKVIRCQFQSAMGSGQGICQDNNGRSFDLVIGSMPGDPPNTVSRQCAADPLGSGRCGS